jgi:hypothetical protein
VTLPQLLQKRAQGLLACAMEGLGSAAAENVSAMLFCLVYLQPYSVHSYCIRAPPPGLSIQGLYCSSNEGDALLHVAFSCTVPLAFACLHPPAVALLTPLSSPPASSRCSIAHAATLLHPPSSSLQLRLLRTCGAGVVGSCRRALTARLPSTCNTQFP